MLSDKKSTGLDASAVSVLGQQMATIFNCHQLLSHLRLLSNSLCAVVTMYCTVHAKFRQEGGRDAACELSGRIFRLAVRCECLCRISADRCV
eukprot:3943037-Amphidinium_carterae.1